MVDTVFDFNYSIVNTSTVTLPIVTLLTNTWEFPTNVLADYKSKVVTYGVINKVPETQDSFYYFWDFDNQDEANVKAVLTTMRKALDLPWIIIAKTGKGYHGYSLAPRDWESVITAVEATMFHDKRYARICRLRGWETLRIGEKGGKEPVYLDTISEWTGEQIDEDIRGRACSFISYTLGSHPYETESIRTNIIESGEIGRCYVRLWKILGVGRR